MKKLEFVECDSCSAKAGSPYLCRGCLTNRETIETANKMLKKIDIEQELFDLEQHLDIPHKMRFYNRKPICYCHCHSCSDRVCYFSCNCGNCRLI